MSTEKNVRSLDEVRRELRIERAVIGAVVHGQRGDNLGFNNAVSDLYFIDVRPSELVPTLWWALSRLPKSMDEPNVLLDRLSTLVGVPNVD